MEILYGIMFVLPYCVLVHSMESLGCQPGFCWQELSWRMPSRRLSTPQPLTSATPQHWWVLVSQRGSKAKMRHLVWTDHQLFSLQVFYSTMDLPVYPEPWHTLFERLSSSSVAENHFWVCQLLSEFAGLSILILMADIILHFCNASGFIRSNTGSRAA